jgi:hypothetical protein
MQTPPSLKADRQRVARRPGPADVVIFDSPRVWIAYFMRQLVEAGFHPKWHRTVTGFDLIDWSVTMAAIFDVADARPGSKRISQTADRLWQLTDQQPSVCRIALADDGNPAEWLLREAGAVAVYHSVFDVAAMITLLQRNRERRGN